MHAMTQSNLEVPRRFRRGQRADDENETMQSAVWLIDHLCEHAGIPDLGGVDLLDIGCGVKFTQAILAHALPLQRYVGVDVYRDMVEFLQDAVTDSRFAYAHIDAHNELYNPTGRPLTDLGHLSVDDQRFDLISLFSVFTHLAPHDFQAMLRLARAHIRPHGLLFFTLFLNETTSGGNGLMDALVRRGAATVEGAEPPAFVDLDPATPLKWAVYSRPYALELIEGTGWEVAEVADPVGFVQHHIVCRPV